MAVKTEKDLSEEERARWLKAVAALELRNFGYAVSLLQGILKQEPEFLLGRQLLRRAEVMRQKTKHKRFFSFSATPVAVLKAQRALKKNPAHAVELAEKILEREPFNKQANLLLKAAAVSAGWLETHLRLCSRKIRVRSSFCTIWQGFTTNWAIMSERWKFTTASMRLTPLTRRQCGWARKRLRVHR